MLSMLLAIKTSKAVRPRGVCLSAVWVMRGWQRLVWAWCRRGVLALPPRHQQRQQLRPDRGRGDGEVPCERVRAVHSAVIPTARRPRAEEVGCVARAAGARRVDRPSPEAVSTVLPRVVHAAVVERPLGAPVRFEQAAVDRVRVEGLKAPNRKRNRSESSHTWIASPIGKLGTQSAYYVGHIACHVARGAWAMNVREKVQESAQDTSKLK